MFTQALRLMSKVKLDGSCKSAVAGKEFGMYSALSLIPALANVSGMES